MRSLYSFIIIALLIAIGYGIGASSAAPLILGAILPYIAFAVFVIGLVLRVIKWARTPVPFRIPTTCGQQQSLPWIQQNKLDNPSTLSGTVGRMFLEVLFFRSLFRNTKVDLKDDKLSYKSSKWLWIAALLFHWCFLVIFLRHFRLFMDPVPGFVYFIQNLDGMLQIGMPVLYITDMLFIIALIYLLLRRFFISEVKYISLVTDYFALFLILSIAATGVLMRHIPSLKVDIPTIKYLMVGIITFSPDTAGVAAKIGAIFYVHLFLICCLLIYFPFSKLVHMGGVFLSPTRNLANNSRMKRHINPWNYPVKVHTYEEYEDEFRGVMKSAGLPLEKEE